MRTFHVLAITAALLVVAATLVAVALLWAVFDLPDSYAEWRLRGELQAKAATGAELVVLSELVKEEWETVCFSHAYDGPLYLQRYGRTYPASDASSDGAWGLLFIQRDGTPTYYTGDGSNSIRISSAGAEHSICVERGPAVLVRRSGGSSPEYLLQSTEL